MCDAAKAIHKSDMFDSESLIDCELLMFEIMLKHSKTHLI